MNNKRKCEHEVYITEEEYITDDKIKITLRCDLCNSKFSGEINRE